VAVQEEDVRRIAELARLRLEADEVAKFTGQLNDILVHMEALADLDAEAAAADAQAQPEAGAPLRSESVAPDALHRAPADIATAWRDGLFVVPRLAAQDRLAEGGDASELEDAE
jgi:aspartyl-tRNA(Asn)/glutamyl-tRNA(Gln) amidotransferase subunit C